MIGIIDYGLGNIKAFANVYKNLNIQVAVVKRTEQLWSVDKIILPGVGSFDFAMESLLKSGLKEKLDDMVLIRHTPVMGICVGMQMLTNSSEEGKLPGLGWIDAEVRKFDFTAHLNGTRIPHMGWNDVRPVTGNLLFKNLESVSKFYFLHSYYVQCNNPQDTIAVSDYGGEFSSAINSKNIYGIQFHPEKSHSWGIQLLKNFSDL